MLDAKAVRQGGIFAVDLGIVRLSTPSLSLSTGFGICIPVAIPRFLFEPSTLYEVAVVVTMTVVTVEVIDVV